MRVDPIDRLNAIYSPDMVRRAKPSNTDANKAAQQAAAAEQNVLARERALKASVPGGTTHTTYTYSQGPDGRMYITGANVSVIASEDDLRGATGRSGRPAGTQTSFKPSAEPQTNDERAKQIKQDPRMQAQIAELEQTQREVIAHEAAHMAAGGQFAGGASYTYTIGPDGKQYITGGEVPISTPATSDPEEALANALQVMRAATAPGMPSGPDMAVAASAAQMAAQARIDMANGEGEDQGASAQTNGYDAYKGASAKDAYAATESPLGLWTRSGGFEPRQDAAQRRPEEDIFETAA